MSYDKEIEQKHKEEKACSIAIPIDDIDKNEHTNTKSKSKLKKNILISIMSVISIIVIMFLVYVNTSYKPQEIAQKALLSDNLVEVKNEEYISFTPKYKQPTKGFIFYPGAKVESESYAPLCREISKQGFEVIVVKMPLNFAIFSPNKASEVIDDYKNIDTWAIGGHSLGGVMAAKFASENYDIKGVVLYASYPQGEELINSNKKVVSMWGSNDSVLNMDSIINSKNDLPKDTKYVEIKGANHAQFGDYGFQRGDKKATISQEEQTKIAVNNTVELLNSLK